MNKVYIGQFTTLQLRKQIEQKFVFNCLLNDTNDDNCLMLSSRLFQAVDPAVRKVRSPRLVLIERFGSARLSNDSVNSSVARRSLIVAETQSSLCSLSPCHATLCLQLHTV